MRRRETTQANKTKALHDDLQDTEKLQFKAQEWHRQSGIKQVNSFGADMLQITKVWAAWVGFDEYMNLAMFSMRLTDRTSRDLRCLLFYARTI
jgi:hypothetical protein